MRELERRVQTMGLTWPSVARELGVDRTTLAHIRTGRDRLSLGILHQIAVWFPNDDAIQRLAWDYLLFEVETSKEREERERTKSSTGGALMAKLDQTAMALIRQIVGEFGRLSVSGSCVLVTGAEAGMLAAAIGYIAAELEARSISVIHERANARVSPSREPSLLGVAALLVERIEYASESTVALLTQRMSLGKVVIATCLDRARLSALGGAAERIVQHFLVVDLGAGDSPVERC